MGPDYLDLAKGNFLKASVIYSRQHIVSLLKARKIRLWSCGIICQVRRQIIMDILIFRDYITSCVSTCCHQSIVSSSCSWRQHDFWNVGVNLKPTRW